MHGSEARRSWLWLWALASTSHEKEEVTREQETGEAER
jgi:hypothetical protein